jgi:hypothetical protein
MLKPLLLLFWGFFLTGLADRRMTQKEITELTLEFVEDVAYNLTLTRPEEETGMRTASANRNANANFSAPASVEPDVAEEDLVPDVLEVPTWDSLDLTGGPFFNNHIPYLLSSVLPAHLFSQHSLIHKQELCTEKN